MLVEPLVRYVDLHLQLEITLATQRTVCDCRSLAFFSPKLAGIRFKVSVIPST